MVVKDVEVNFTPDWANDYFDKIKGVCPWSFRAMKNDNILFIENGGNKCYGTWSYIYKASNKEAFVFIEKDKTPKELDEICEKYEKIYKHVQWLWSHPDEGGDSTPVPTIIIQDKARLQTLREKIGYEEDID